MSSVLPAPSPARLLHGAVSHFTPNWFAVTMGTGALALVLAAQPWGGAARLALAETLWRADAVAFALCLALLLARLTLFPQALAELLRHPLQSLFFGALPMGAVPLINGLVLFAGPRTPAAYTLAEALWWLDAALSLLVAVGVPYWVFTSQEHRLERLTAALLLPIVAPEVAASSAAVIAPHLAPAAAQRLVDAGYVLWGVSVPLAFSVLTVVLVRLILHKLPGRELGVTSWLTLGPIGTGALGLITLGEAGVPAFAGTPLAGVMAAARDLGVLGALLLWGVGLWWLACALLFTAHYLRDGLLPFNLGWWGFTFPLGVYVLATLALARTTGSPLLAGLGQALALLLAGLWLLVAGRTLAELARLARR
ncbi:C4-dicarboxylate ABC transporter [Roseateles saccharophilus]|uniref:C4-dicarboxylate transporter/malic acid transport protein n=1 Tax=Roseateles saccharophilus TaxID=304 RepID=A0A4R3V2H6_ROSSA|nr:C4-dicarboxylate ABC transporter [Roseateles saccharophilus]MDG0831926.1 C4-dicarboxylate ABC transporter [Roseateles saccharophilus]TCU97408.1 C4-dicarboxylate transporter/malic acid transport protein [Roseateles saccharophilus]